jgi:hypothetical protein
VDLEEDGKTVWFSPAGHPSDTIVDGLITGDPTGRAEAPRPDDVRVEVRGVPLRLFIDFQRHYRELRREVRLLALAHESEYPLARDLAELFGTLERDLRDGLGARQIDDALQSGSPTADLALSMPRESASMVGRFIELLDLADDFCRQQRLLSLARTPDQARFQRWFLGELVRQQAGEPPVAWQDAPVRTAAGSEDGDDGTTAPDTTSGARSEGSLA